MRILLDTNVILDVLLDRQPWVSDAAQIWQLCSAGQVDGYVCATSITNIFYIAHRLTDRARARAAIRLCIATFRVCPVDREALLRADSLSGDDIEDNLQIASAMIADLDAIITRDPEGFRHSPVRAFTAADFLRHLLEDRGVGNNS